MVTVACALKGRRDSACAECIWTFQKYGFSCIGYMKESPVPFRSHRRSSKVTVCALTASIFWCKYSFIVYMCLKKSTYIWCDHFLKCGLRFCGICFIFKNNISNFFLSTLWFKIWFFFIHMLSSEYIKQAVI